MLRKRVYLGIMLVFVLVVAGCSGGSLRNKDIGDPQNTNFRTGSEGLVIDNPLDALKVYEGDREVQLIYEIRNEGAFPQPDQGGLEARLDLEGFDRNIIDFRPDPNRRIDEGTVLEGKSIINPNGGFLTVVWNGQVNSLPEGVEVYEPKILATLTYNYETVASPEVCIDPNPRNTRVKEKACDVANFRSISLSGTQGAPVAVSRVEEEVTSKSALFRIYIKNVGNGVVVDRRELGRRDSSGFDATRIETVQLDDVSVGNDRAGVSCNPSIGSDIQLVDQEGFIFCRFNYAYSDDNVYTTPLNIKLRYAYAIFHEQQISIFKEVT